MAGTEKITLSIDGKQVEVKKGTTVLEAAKQAGIYIPTLCYHPSLAPYGGCRLCVVEIEKIRGLPPSCTTPAENGMVVKTDTPQLQEFRRGVMELILSEHPHTCLICDRRQRCQPYDICLRSVDVSERCVLCSKNGICELQLVADFIGIKEVKLPYTYKAQEVLTNDPLLDRDYNLCILCARCTRACNELRGIGAISLMQRGKDTYVGTAFNRPLAEANCRFCGTCVEVCPTGALKDKAKLFKKDKKREEVLVPCRNECPAGIDVPRYIRFINEKKYSEAVAVIREKVPFPNVLGHVCAHPCETVCRRNELNEAIAIKELKRFAAEHATKKYHNNAKKLPATGKKVAVVGAGPAGLTAAYYLGKLGHSVTVFEALPVPGGMLRVGIPEYRLPRDVLNEEINEMKEVGFEIKANTRIESVDDLFGKGFNAVFLATGAHLGNKIGVPGDDSLGVIDAVAFLRQVSLGEKVNPGEKVAVIGGGNVAIDAARVALRVGSKNVDMIYRRTRAEMPANDEEVEGALEEGVNIVFLAAPSKIWQENGVLKLQCVRMELGEIDASGRRRPVPVKGSEFTVEYNSIISAIGQVIKVPAGFNVATGRGDVIKTSADSATSRKGVFAGGDVVSGPGLAIGAIAWGRKGAIAIDKYLGGKGVIDEIFAPLEDSAWLGCVDQFAKLERQAIPSLPGKERASSFVEVEKGYDEEMAAKESLRCLQCQLRLCLPAVEAPPAK